MAETPGADIVAAMFETEAAANEAKAALVAAGVPLAAISVVAAGPEAAPSHTIWRRIREIFVHDHNHAHIFAEGVARGRAMVFVRAAEEATQQAAMRTLESRHPVDLNHRVSEWAKSGWSGQHAGMPQHEAVPPLLFSDTEDLDHIPTTGLLNETESVRPIGARLLNPMGIEVPGIAQSGTSRVARYSPG